MHFKTLKELDTTEGTVQLLNANFHQQHLGKTDIVLFPQPSQNPNDPLRWPTMRKHAAFLSICLFSALNNFSGTVLSDSFFTISIDLGVSLNKATGLISWVILTLGLANFFWVPTALYFGKRPVFLASCAITFVAAIWAAASTGFGSLQAACIIGAFGGGASEALGAAIINDIYFLHERGSKMGIYIISIAFGSSLGPLCGGYLIQNKGWAWGKWLSAILLGINLLAIVFFCPETRFDRSTDLAEGLDDHNSTHAKSMPNEDNNSDDVLDKTAHAGQIESTSPEKQDLDLHRTRSSIPAKKTYLQLLNPWSGIYRHATYFELMFRPLPLIAYPACIFATLTYSIALAPTVMVNVLSSPLLIPPPYKFTVGAVGLINIPGMIGQAAGAIMGGMATDKYAAYRARRSGGTFHPETRLTLIFVPCLIVFVGILLFGFAAEDQMSWPVLFVAYGFISVGLTGAAAIAMNYVMDSYFPVAAECLELVNGLKNCVAFAFVKASVPWVEHQGYAKTFGALGGIFVAFVIMVIPLAIWGPRIRHYTSTRWRLISWQLE